MDFSVLMSVYGKDNPDYYRLALESVTTNQIVKPKQIVIVYDGPVPVQVDEITNDIKEKNPGILFSIIKQEVNKGLASALNIGLQHCLYEYVARMDSDDISLPTRFKMQVEYVEKNPETDLLGGYISEFIDTPENTITIRRVGLSRDEILHMAKRRTPFNHVTVFYRKTCVLSVGGYAEDFGKLEDYRLWVDLISAGFVFANIDDILVNVRTGDGQIQRRSSRREITDWDRLQAYLLRAGIITRWDSFTNKLLIRIFTLMPASLKKIAYKTVLRDKTTK